MSRRWRTLSGLLVAFSILCWFLPLFHIRPLGGDETGQDLQATTEPARSQQAGATQTNAEPTSAEPTSAGAPGSLALRAKGTDVQQLWDAFDQDAVEARKQYGRQAGLGGAFYFCITGQGTIQSVEGDRVMITVDGSPRRVCLELGVVVGNTVREALGVKASDFKNSQEFNAVSTEFNRQVEQDIIAPNRDRLQPGALVQFTGCAKLGGQSDLNPICLVPIQLTVQGHDTSSAGTSAKASGELPP
ncbi:MAG: DUF2291 family protein [Pirellulaceae bacterium]|nr:DUF2291 family protein [Pirellulaceae bacterium]